MGVAIVDHGVGTQCLVCCSVFEQESRHFGNRLTQVSTRSMPCVASTLVLRTYCVLGPCYVVVFFFRLIIKNPRGIQGPCFTSLLLLRRTFFCFCYLGVSTTPYWRRWRTPLLLVVHSAVSPLLQLYTYTAVVVVTASEGLGPMPFGSKHDPLCGSSADSARPYYYCYYRPLIPFWLSYVSSEHRESDPSSSKLW